MSSVRRALAFSTLGRMIRLAAGVVSVIIVARLLTPEEIGIFAVSAAALNIVQSLREFGVTGYLIQEKELNTTRIRSAYGVSFLVGWSVAALLIALSGVIAAFYGEPNLQDMILILSISFVLLPFGTPAYALMVREMRFDLTMRIMVGAALASPITTIVLALNGFSYYSLAWGQVAGSAATVLVTLWYRPAETWLLPGFREWRRVISFGIKSSAIETLDGFTDNIVALVVGRILGFGPVGVYSRATGVLNLFQAKLMQSAYAVVSPAFARISREDREPERPYLLAISCITAVSWPFVAVCALMAYPFVRVLFGDQWDASVPILRIVCLGGAFYALWSIIGRVLVSTGHINEKLKATVMTQALFAMLVVPASFVGLEAVAIAFVFMNIFGMCIGYYYLKRCVGIGLTASLRGAGKSVLPTVTALIGPIAVTLVLGLRPEQPLIAMGAAGPLSLAGWLAGLFVIRHPLAGEITNAIQLARKGRPLRKAAE